MSSEEQAWSFTDWQCGMGIVDSCRNQKVDWDEPRSWQLVVDQIVPLTEVGIVFGMQYISSSIGPGVTKAMNSIRCMFNSGVSSLWQFGAGTWLLIKYAGFAEEVRTYLDEGYLYVCTCIYDLNGLKEMLGQSAESNAQFSTCSEEAGLQRIKANEEKRQYEEEQKRQAGIALVTAAKNKKVGDTKALVLELDGCSNRTTSALSDTKCFAAAEEFYARTLGINKFWATKVWSTGGTESTKNKEEQTNLEESSWVLEGVIQALNELYPKRFNAEGVLQQSCTDPTSGLTQWGDDCTSIIEAWVAAASPVPYCQGDACNAAEAIKCHEGNDAANQQYTTTDNCELVTLEHGYSQWQDKALITCTDPLFNNLTGFTNCINIGGVWQPRSGYVNPDQPRFRTFGENVATLEKEGAVTEEGISCLAADYYTIRTGSANCYPYWLEGGSVEVGVNASGVVIKQDTFIWTTLEGVECGIDATTGLKLTGTESCKVDTRTVCNASKLTRLNIDSNSSSICMPTLTWTRK